jgi:hypothetical protein
MSGGLLDLEKEINNIKLVENRVLVILKHSLLITHHSFIDSSLIIHHS